MVHFINIFSLCFSSYYNFYLNVLLFRKKIQRAMLLFFGMEIVPNLLVLMLQALLGTWQSASVIQKSPISPKTVIVETGVTGNPGLEYGPK
jgi:hypothetical protein